MSFFNRFIAKSKKLVFEGIKAKKNCIKTKCNSKMNTLNNVSRLKSILNEPKERRLEMRLEYILEHLDKSVAYETLRQERWNGTVYCIKCGSKHIERTNLDEDNYEYRCQFCRHEFNDTSNTPLENSNISIEIWMLCWYLYGCTDSLMYIAKHLKIDEQDVKNILSSLKSTFNVNKPLTNKLKLKLKKSILQEYKLHNKLNENVIKEKQKLILGKESIDEPKDTAEDRKLKDRRKMKVGLNLHLKKFLDIFNRN